MPQLTDIIFENLNIYDNFGSILYHNYPYKASSYIYLVNINWTNNIQDNSGFSSDSTL